MSLIVRKIKNTIRNTIIIVFGSTILLEVTTHIPTQGKSSKFYHIISDNYITPLLRKYCTNPETAHDIAIYISKYTNLTPTYHPSVYEQKCNVQCNIKFKNKNIRNIITSNPIGLGAGFDKNGDIINSMIQLGFGFVEIGTVTPKPQDGNPKPRMFRLTKDHAIINRYGFNSKGLQYVKNNLQLYRKQQQKEKDEEKRILKDKTSTTSFLYSIYQTLTNYYNNSNNNNNKAMIGVNIGKNKITEGIENIINDYTILIQELGPYADYLVINVSSPNTENLRDLQQKDNLQLLLQSCINTRNAIQDTYDGSLPSLFIKLAPDLNNDELYDIANVCINTGIDGIIVTNTTNTRPDNLIEHHLSKEIGGLSGKPIKDISTNIIYKLYKYTNGTIPIIGVGGIENANDIYTKIRAGASLVQIYTTLIYNGPGYVSTLRNNFAKNIVLLNGYNNNIQDIIGLDHTDIKFAQALQNNNKQIVGGNELTWIIDDNDIINEDNNNIINDNDEQK